MEPLTAVVIGVFVFKELFTLNSVIGILLILFLGWFCLMKLFPPEFREIPTSLESIRAELNALGGLNTKEIRTLVVFLKIFR